MAVEPDIFMIVAGYFAVIFIPGFLWTRVLTYRSALERWESILVSLVVGFVIVTASIFFASFLFRFPVSAPTLAGIVVLLASVPLVILYRRNDPAILQVVSIIRSRRSRQGP